MKRTLLAILSLAAFAIPASATDEIPVLYGHYLNILRGADGGFIVQSHVSDRDSAATRKNSKYQATLGVKALGKWVEKKEKDRSLRIRMRKDLKTQVFTVEFERHQTVGPTQELKFAGVTLALDPGK